MVDETAYTHMSLPDYDEVADIEILNNNFNMIDTMIAQIANLESLSYDTAPQQLNTLAPLAYADDDVSVPDNLFQLGYNLYAGVTDVVEFWGMSGYLVRDLCELWSHIDELVSLSDYSTELTGLGSLIASQDIVLDSSHAKFVPQDVHNVPSASMQIDEYNVSMFDCATFNKLDSTLTMTAYDTSSRATLDSTTIKIAEGEHTVTMSTGSSVYGSGGYVRVYAGSEQSGVTMTDVDVYTGYETHWGDGDVDRVGASPSLNRTIEGMFQRINALDHLDD